MLIVKAEFHVDADDSQQAVDHVVKGLLRSDLLRVGSITGWDVTKVSDRSIGYDGPIWEIAYKYVEDGVVVD